MAQIDDLEKRVAKLDAESKVLYAKAENGTATEADYLRIDAVMKELLDIMAICDEHI